MLEVGSLLDGKYKILNEIGRGGMSVVYLALNERANKTWAVKEVRKDGGNDTTVVSQGLVAETEMLKKLDHPNLPSIIDVIDKDDSFIIVMDYIEGNSLQHLLEVEGPQHPEKVIEWAKQLCDVLGYLHSRRPPIIYRDMKPANVMLRPEGDVTLIDFGTAREYKDTRNEDTTWLGTRGYAAPEQFGGRGQTDGRTDIYNLGATMYHLVTGYSPADTNFEIRPVGDFLPHLKGSGLEKIITKCCRPDPKDRYQNCAELMYALENVHKEDDAVRARRKRRLAGFLASIVISVIAAIAGVGFRVAYSSTREQEYDRHVAASATYTEFSQKMEEYRQAMDLDPGNPVAYQKLIEDIEGLPEISVPDYEKIIECLHSTDGDSAHRKFNIDFLKDQDIATYADFNFRLGSMIYLGYPSGKGNAREFLGQAVESGALSGQTLGEAQLMLDLAEAYQKRKSSDAEVKKAGQIKDSTAYHDYWDKLDALTTNLSSLQDQTGSIGYPIRVCDEVATELTSPRLLNYNEQGVTEADMRIVLERASTFMNQAKGASAFQRSEIDRVRPKMKDAADALDDFFGSPVHANPSDTPGTNGGSETGNTSTENSGLSTESGTPENGSDTTGTTQ
ncbi:MAG: serine/threonine-protein kinase [Eubacteriales bacterium]|nr:serine/threonine-protein kinase [Eubacteriales bacterium]